jgi:PD-(D/E)XK nuclease superfamily
MYKCERKELKMKISRNKIELFCRCERCFWLKIVKSISIPEGPAFTLNAAVDHLLKNEMDHHRKTGTVPPILKAHGLSLVPFQHENLDRWRANFTGITVNHARTGLEIFGAIDDVWVNGEGTLHVVDYKATSKKDDPSLDGGWGPSYRRQVEIYQWLFRQNGFEVSDIAYFVYANGLKGDNHFKDTLKFKTTILSHEGNTQWIEPMLERIRSCMDSQLMPSPAPDCKHCEYTTKVHEILSQIPG